MRCAVSLATVTTALFFYFFVQVSELGSFVGGILWPVELGIRLGEVEMNFGAAGIELCGNLKFAQGFFPFA